MNQERSQRPLVIEGVTRIVVGIALLAVILFVPAGRWDWMMGWALIAVCVVLVLVNWNVLMAKNPEVVRERMHGGKGVKLWDKIVAGSMGPFALVMLLLPGLDRRFAWSEPIALWLQITGLVLLAAGDLFFLWAMAVNKFFASMVRIQTERGHHVVSDGPYRYVRHPGYVSWLAMMFGLALALGSVWALPPAGIMAALMLLRTALEDRTLKSELAGYAEYAERVRYRLIPGVW
ncbi:MAG: isoprenylcysteine carboxylmethyltransferase family protein [Gemmatimonadota bacterium]|nr:MAG: isoprenylcysteine carboxylmethyltransferase family protein [Gemmatimonadota bacterium]